jgi:hypothetical protein
MEAVEDHVDGRGSDRGASPPPHLSKWNWLDLVIESQTSPSRISQGASRSATAAVISGNRAA